MLRAELANGFEDMCLGGDIKACRGFVENDDRRTKEKGHGDAHPLLLTAGELVWIPSEEGFVGWQLHLAQRLADAIERLT